jgi:vacuolar-type H+-ATPase subunit H
VELFAAIVSYRHYNPKDNLVFRDQSAMNTLMKEPEFAKHIMQAPQRWFNAYQGEHNETLQPFQVRRGDLLVHFAGVPAREERMHYWLERAEQHLDDWEVPVKSTSYIQEARDFWNQQREVRKHRNTQVAEARDKAQKLLSLTDTNLNDYGDRLEDDQRKKIGSQRDELKTVIEQEANKNNLEKIQESMNKLLDISEPLTIVVAEANKQLLKSAHEAIFAGEKDLLDGGFGQGASSPEMEQISAHVQKLKALVMSPQDGWNHNDIKSTINDVTESRAKLQEKLAADIEAQKQAAEKQAAAQKEANEADAAVTDTETEPNAAVGDDAAANVVVTAPGPTLSATTSVTSTSLHDASPTPLLPVGQGS